MNQRMNLIIIKVKILQNKNISAIFCADDTMAFGCMDFIKDKTKYKIPSQIEVIGFDDMLMANWESYKLSTIKQPIRQMSKLVTQLIDEYISYLLIYLYFHVIQNLYQLNILFLRSILYLLQN